MKKKMKKKGKRCVFEIFRENSKKESKNNDLGKKTILREKNLTRIWQISENVFFLTASCPV